MGHLSRVFSIFISCHQNIFFPVLFPVRRFTILNRELISALRADNSLVGSISTSFLNALRETSGKNTCREREQSDR